MGKTWHIGHHQYTDCDHCDLTYRGDSHMLAEHLAGSCVKIYGPRSNKGGTSFEYGKSTQAEPRSTIGQQERIKQPEPDAPGSGVVGTPFTPWQDRRVEKGWA